MPIRWRLSWSRSCWYGFCPDAATFEIEKKKVLNKCHLSIGDYPDTTGMTIHYRTPDRRHLVTLADRLDDRPFELVSTIAHEATHVAYQIFDAMREEEPGEETMAYTIGIVTEHLFEDYMRSPRGQRFKEMARG